MTDKPAKKKPHELINVEEAYTAMKDITHSWARLDTPEELAEAFTNLAANFSALNEALSNGRELPEAWKAGRKNQPGLYERLLKLEVFTGILDEDANETYPYSLHRRIQMIEEGDNNKER